MNSTRDTPSAQRQALVASALTPTQRLEGGAWRAEPLLGMPLTYINLDQDSARREQLTRSLAAHGLQGQRFAAVRWRDLAPDVQAGLGDRGRASRRFHRPLAAGEMGCYASHVAIWHALVNATGPEAPTAVVVLEDDAKLRPSFVASLTALAAQARAHSQASSLAPARRGAWDMVKLIGRLDASPSLSGPAPGERALLRPRLSPQSQLVGYRRVPSLTAGYCITRAGAAKLLASCLPMARPIDVDLRHYWEAGVVVRGLRPAAIELDALSETSSVGAKPQARDLAWRLRRWDQQLRYSILNAWHASLDRLDA